MHSKKWLRIGLVLTVVMALAVTAISVSAAWPGRGGGDMPGMRMGGSLLTVVAEQLDLELEDLLTELQAGKTIAALAEEKGVATDAIVEAALTSYTEELTQAVEDGYLTQAQADAHLALHKANLDAWLTQSFEDFGDFGMGRGMGDMGRGSFGPGGMRGRGGMWGGADPSTPDVTPEETPEANT